MLLLKPHAKIWSSHMAEPGREASDVIIDTSHQKEKTPVVSAPFVLKEWGNRPQLLVCQLSPLTMEALCFQSVCEVEQVYIVIMVNRPLIEWWWQSSCLSWRTPRPPAGNSYITGQLLQWQTASPAVSKREKPQVLPSCCSQAIQPSLIPVVQLNQKPTVQ